MNGRAEGPVVFALAAALGIVSCDDAPPATADIDPRDCAQAVSLPFVPDVGDASEAYVCYGFDASAFATRAIGSVHWDIASSTALSVHHATLYAIPGDYPDGPKPCDGMPPDAVEVHVWSPGSGDLELPADVGLRLPENARRFVIEVHALRLGAGAASQSRALVCARDSPAQQAAHIGMEAPVPALRPLHVETSTGSCTLAGDVHLWSIWPHMHRAGKDILGELVHTDGTAQTLVHVSAWDFTNQKTYPLSVDATAGDAIRATCTWDNQTTNTILPGPLTEDEMCNLALIAWPADAAVCR